MHDMPETTPEAARTEIDALPLNAEILSILQDPAHPGHKAATAHRRALYDAAYPAPATPDEPGDGATAENMVKDRPAGGSLFDTPSSPAEYRFDATPPDLHHDPALERKARGWFHEAGLPSWLARNIVNEWNRRAAEPTNSDRTDKDAATAEAALRRRWAAAYEDKIALANGVLQEIGDDQIYDLLDRSGFANNEYLIRQLAALAESREGR